MAWPNGSRLKTFSAGGSFLPADANAIEDRMLQIAGYRGKSIIDTEEARTNTAFGLLTTPDQVTGIVMPTDGKLCIAYQALWKNSVASAAQAAIFLGANQLKIHSSIGGAPVVISAGGVGPVNTYAVLHSSPATGLTSHDDPTAALSAVTTGQLIGCSGTTFAGGVAEIFAAAGTYDVSVQFKASSGSVTAKERKLWVWTEAFA
jgi:hypothetical protein